MTIRTENTEAFGDFLRGIQSTLNPLGLGRISPKLQAAIGLDESIPSEGGFTVPADFSAILMQRIRKQTDIASLCTKVPVKTGNRTNFPAVDEKSRANNGSRWGGIFSAWNVESSTIAASKAAFVNRELILNKITCAAWATEELLDSSELLGTFIELVFPLEAAFRLDEAILLGSGEGQPLGILNSNALITVAKDSGQAAGTISSLNVTNMFGRMSAANRRNAVWLVSAEVEEQLYELSLGTGPQAMLLTPGDDGAQFGRLMNRPIVPMEQCSNIGTVGDIVFCDPTFYLIADKPLDIAFSIHVQFVSGQCVFRLQYRVDGQPALRSPITPYNGGSTKSAFVTLAAR